MSSKRMNDSFLVETQSEETERLLHTCGTSEIKEFVSLEEMKNLNKEENFKWQEKNKEKVCIERNVVFKIFQSCMVRCRV